MMVQEASKPSQGQVKRYYPLITLIYTNFFYSRAFVLFADKMFEVSCQPPFLWQVKI